MHFRMVVVNVIDGNAHCGSARIPAQGPESSRRRFCASLPGGGSEYSLSSVTYQVDPFSFATVEEAWKKKPAAWTPGLRSRRCRIRRTYQ